MKLVYLGSGQFGIESLNALAGSQHSLVLVVTQPPHPAGRGRKERPTPVACWAKANSTPFIETDNINDSAVIDRIAGCRADLLVVIAFGQKIGNEVIALPSKGTINVHASLLPKYRGAAPINWAIINGERQTGVSIVAVVEKMDTGDILAQAGTDIGPDETAGRLHDRLARMAPVLLLKTLSRIAAGTADYVPQDHSKATLAPKLKKSDGSLDFSDTAETLRKRILGLWPWPGASALYVSKKTAKSQRVTIAMAQVAVTANPAGLPPGTLDENLDVICGQDALRIAKLKPAGCSLMDFKSFVNGRQSCPGDRFSKTDTGC